MLRRSLHRSSLSLNRSVRLRSFPLALHRKWQQRVRQQIALKRGLHQYLFSNLTPRTIPLESVMGLLKAAEQHRHPQIHLLWQMIEKTSSDLEAVCFCVTHHLHTGPSFHHFIRQINFSDPIARAKMVWCAVAANNIDFLQQWTSGDYPPVLENSLRLPNCLLEAYLQNHIHLQNWIARWGVIGVQHLSAAALFLLQKGVPTHWFIEFLQKLPPGHSEEAAKQCAQMCQFAEVPTSPKTFLLTKRDLELVQWLRPALRELWETAQGFRLPLMGQECMFTLHPSHHNSEIINKIGSHSASVFIAVVAPHLDVVKHFHWALRQEDFNLASLLLPFVPSDAPSPPQGVWPSASFYPDLHRHLLSTNLNEAVKYSSPRPRPERPRKM